MVVLIMEKVTAARATWLSGIFGQTYFFVESSRLPLRLAGSRQGILCLTWRSMRGGNYQHHRRQNNRCGQQSSLRQRFTRQQPPDEQGH